MEGTENSLELVESNSALDYVPEREIEVWWFLVAIGGLMVLVSVVLLFKRKMFKADEYADKRKAYEESVEAFDTFEETEPRKEAVVVSYILRSYLAKSLGEPALFETQEELVGRNDALAVLPGELRDELNLFLTKLAGYKYSPDGEGVDSSTELKSEGREFLERMYRA